MADTTQTANLDTTIAALQGDLTAIPPEQAIALIDTWQQQLKGHDIAEDLGELKQALQSGDAASIADILTDLGEDTAGTADQAPSDVSSKVQRLGALLTQAGSSLS